MKLVLLGGGSVRSPLFVSAVARRAARLKVDELWLLDIDAQRLRLFGAIAKWLVAEAGTSLRIVESTDPRAALSDADHIVTTIRVGGEEGRVLDETIASRHGVLGQETTGAGGFAMAARSIPAAVRYAELASEVAPNAWIYNFTNPAGLVTQALRDLGHERTIGICDGANAGTRAVAGFCGVDVDRLRAEVFGLNHLSWTRRIDLDGEDLLAPLLADPAFHAATSLGLFDTALVREKGLWINEYLYYFYYARESLREHSTAVGRARQISELDLRLFERLRQVDPTRDPAAAMVAVREYHQVRSATYMLYPRFGVAENESLRSRRPAEAADEGYAGVALDAIEAIATARPVWTALNVPNEGVIQGLEPGDVVEVSCVVDGHGAHPTPLENLPLPEIALTQAVKAYERLAVGAILRRSRSAAVTALLAHPLIPSYRIAEVLVEEYLAAHKESVGQWS